MNLLQRLRAHIANMAPHQKDRQLGKLILDAELYIAKLEGELAEMKEHARNLREQIDMEVGYNREKLGCELAEAKTLLAETQEIAVNAATRESKLRAELAEARSTVEKCWECETKLRAEVENARVAFGEHPDSPLDLPQRISELRDEARGMFHANTKLSEDKRELRDENDALKRLLVVKALTKEELK